MINHTNFLNEQRLLEHRLTYGFYPQVINHPGEEKRILQQLSDSLLYKDLFSLESIKKPYLREKLIQALVLQLGSEVNYHELANTIGADKETIER